MNSTLETLRAWSEQGWLRRLDSAFADFVFDHDRQATPAVLVASAMLAQMEGRGHVCLPLSPLVRQPQSVLAWPDDARAALEAFWPSLPDDPREWVNALVRSPVVRDVRGLTRDLAGDAARDAAEVPIDAGQPLVLGGTRDAPLLYLRRYWVYERQVAEAVDRHASTSLDVDQAAAKQWLDRMFPQRPDSTAQGDRHDWQKIACALALRRALTVITGGPGTGKTYTAARLLALLLATSPNPGQLRVALAAPTGKAAARLRQSIDQSLDGLQRSLGASVDLHVLIQRIGKASTVHSLLGMRMGTRQFDYNAQHPLDLDVLIVDETSMVHLEMMAALLQAMPPGARLILLGDKDQLASVEAGSVLGDLCAHAQHARYDPETRRYLQAVCGEQLSPSDHDGSALDQQTVMLRHTHRFGTDIGALARAVNAGVARTAAGTTQAPTSARPTRAVPDARAASVPQPVQGTLFPEGTAATAPGLEGAYDLLARGTRQVTSDSARQQDSAARTDGRLYLMSAPVRPAAVVQLAMQGRPLAPACFADYLRIIRDGPAAGAAGDAAARTDDTHTAWVKRVLKAFDRFRILCAVHDGDWGDRAINEEVQRALAKAGLIQVTGEWFVGRPVMVTRNDKAQGVFNGDVGVVLPAFGSHALRAWFLDGDQLRSVAVTRLAHVETAFAMTVHKSQGSEFDHTVVVLPATGGDILTRELVYTGITRAREQLTLIEPREGMLGEAIAQQVKRASGLNRGGS